jgi:CRISPR-associated endonuclease/helicase Cas3
VTNKHDNILAKPSGITLADHISNVISEAKTIKEMRQNTFNKYEKITGASFFNRLEFVCKYHDEGKKCNKWQSACQKDYKNYLDWKKAHNGNFNDYKLEMKEEAGKHIRNASVRHELDSLKYLNFDNIPLSVATAIAAHHSKLSSKNEERWKKENKYELWKKFKTHSNKISEKEDFEESIIKHYEFAGLRSYLQLADRRASAKEEDNSIPDFTKFNYDFPEEWQKRNVQKLVEDNWDKDLLLVRAPTGAGKTDASLLWAKKQIENGRADRLIIAMPTRFTSTALSIEVTKTLSETGLYHSSAWFNKFENAVKEKDIERNEAKSIHDFARLLETSTTVCTIDHLLTSLTLSREDHHHIAFNLANSCLVIDEADFYDEFIQANILVLLKVLKTWQVPVLLMSASLPESAIEDYKSIGYDIDKIIEDKSDNERDRFAIKSIIDYSNVNDISHLLDKCIEKDNAIIFVNTIESAINIYHYFTEKKVLPILYHSRFTEPDKKKKENQLIEALGKDAWSNGKAKGIAILTQIGEMSINISADLMISELCPIDRLTQRAGRLCRFSKDKIGELHVIIPQKDDKIYPAPYGNYDRKAKEWVAIDELIETKEYLDLINYNANQLIELLNRIYKVNKEKNIKSKKNAETLKQMFINNWLINPNNTIDIDASDNLDWQSRDIYAQESVYVRKPESIFFYSYNDFHSWKIENSLELPLYIFEKLKKHQLCSNRSLFIGKKEENIIILNEETYNFNIGVNLPSKAFTIYKSFNP